MKLSNIRFYGRSREKICRLGLAHIFLELQEIFISTEIRVLEVKHANNAGAVREMIDQQFSSVKEWVCAKAGDIDWVKRIRYNHSIIARLGVEIQVSGRSDLLARDIIHIRNSLQDSHIDVGVIVVPSDEFEYFLTDRVANFSYALRYVETELREAVNYPVVLIGVEHDGFTDAPLPKKVTNRGRAEKGPSASKKRPKKP